MDTTAITIAPFQSPLDYDLVGPGIAPPKFTFLQLVRLRTTDQPNSWPTLRISGIKLEYCSAKRNTTGQEYLRDDPVWYYCLGRLDNSAFGEWYEQADLALPEDIPALQAQWEAEQEALEAAEEQLAPEP
ncbi:hypothetical protein [Gloeobacter morelensis]|uniref:hypothetical protein n=1 Tax=Gloeobacter morelensis TaxID=2907343 RepID=UPI001E5E4908|nr:hypothetical protein [Gloeobacter morelensis]UFP97282.1 hypothetical protein ISF26_24485 [Gloeobacter morelensis MG652769]